MEKAQAQTSSSGLNQTDFRYGCVIGPSGLPRFWKIESCRIDDAGLVVIRGRWPVELLELLDAAKAVFLIAEMRHEQASFIVRGAVESIEIVSFLNGIAPDKEKERYPQAERNQDCRP